MKTIIIFVVLMILYSCDSLRGPQGPMGPAGPTNQIVKTIVDDLLANTYVDSMDSWIFVIPDTLTDNQTYTLNLYVGPQTYWQPPKEWYHGHNGSSLLVIIRDVYKEYAGWRYKATIIKQ